MISGATSEVTDVTITAMNAIATRRRSPAISGASRRSAEPMVGWCS
jgi:hypothetical protein